jgi:DNA/RNA-binding domain of Phe-tRNA-synthetase-like protein
MGFAEELLKESAVRGSPEWKRAFEKPKIDRAEARKNFEDLLRRLKEKGFDPGKKPPEKKPKYIQKKLFE